MRVVHTLGAVVACGIIAGVSGVLQSAPSRAAVMLPPIATVAPNDDLVAVRRSGSVETHFAAANVTHDGHLTREQALAADWPKVVKNFDEIDTDHKGWVSVEQIHAFNKSHHKHRKPAVA